MSKPPKRVMIADSEANFARTLQAEFEKRGYQVAVCHDGLECVSRIREDPPALLIVDTQLPVLDGFQVTGVAREVRPDLPVVVMSSYDLPGLKREAAEAGAYACVIKPFEADHLFGLVEQALARPGAAAAARKRQPLLSLARLEPGQPLVLEMRSGQYTGPYKSRLLARHAASLAAACPQIGGVAFSPPFGTRVAVGYALADGWYRFETTVIGSTREDGQPALLLAQPRLVTHLQRRRFARFRASLPARFGADDGGDAAQIAAQVADLSRGGMRITATTAPSPGTRVTVTAQAPEPAGEMKIQAQAVWSERRAGDTPQYAIGLRFVDLPGRAAAGLAQWVDEVARLSAPGQARNSWLPVVT